MSEKKSKVNKGEKKQVWRSQPLVAKRSHVIHQNEWHFEISEGDDLSDEKKFPKLLEKFRSVLEIEKVI